LHYLITLGHKPACLDQSAVYRHWKLPPLFAELRAKLEARHGPPAGARQYIRVLQLLAEHPQERVLQAIESCLAREVLHIDLILERVEHLRHRSARDDQLQSDLAELRVPLPDLRRFDQLLSSRENWHECPSHATAQSESKTVTPTLDVCGV
jgi:hypothetical protein